MSTKDLFNKGNKVLTKSQEEKIKKDLESPELARDVVRSNNKFHSHIDFSKPENFSFYGSAQKYYEDSFNRIYQTYPYDGSLSEKEKWLHDSSELDLWILDNAYPKSTGYVRLGANQSIFVKGGPNNQPGVVEGEKEELSKQFPVKQGNSNIWDTSIYRNSNLYVDGDLGNTVEFWAKLENTFSGRVVLYNVANEAQTTILSATYFSTGLLVLTVKDDTGTSTTVSPTIIDLLTDSWNHISFCTVNEGSQVKFEVYKNGALIYTNTVGNAPMTSVSQAELSLNINGASNGALSTDGLYIDEFRFWKRRRTEEEIGRYWHTHIHGGTNTDNNKYNLENRKVDIGVYYKFNEGITGNTSIDSTVLDYSGRISNGAIINYSEAVRNTASAFDESGFFEVLEEKEPIIYSAHPDFASIKQTYMDEGLNYDYTNNSSIYHTMPAWIIEEDEEKGENVKELSQVISSYFDSAQIKIKELVNLKDVEYHTLEERTNKPYSLIRKTLESAGMVVPDLFTEASAFEEILSRGEQEKFEEKLQDVKNTIYQNIYNNLSYIYKSKGTEKAFRNLIRCFGIDDELVKINLYSDGADYTLEDTRRTTAIKKKFVDFNNADREDGLVYTKEDPNNVESISHIKGFGSLTIPPNLAFTFETEIIFPKRLSNEHPEYDPPSEVEEHIAYLGKYLGGYSSEVSYFDLKAVKENNDPFSENVKFVLDFNGQVVETDYFKSVYENSKWNIAVRLVPKKHLSTVVEGTDSTEYTAELYCVRMLADTVEDEEWVVATVLDEDAKEILRADKFVSIGASKQTGNPETGAAKDRTRLKISSTLFWYDNVTNEEIRAHASDASNFGRLYPSEEAYMFDENFNTGNSEAIQVPRRDTLVMHWDFSEVTTTDVNGEFIVDDLSGSLEKVMSPINDNAIRFDGAANGLQSNTDIMIASDSNVFTFSDSTDYDNGATHRPFTLSAWVKLDTYDRGVIISKFSSKNGPPNDPGDNRFDNELIFWHLNNGQVGLVLYDSQSSFTGNRISKRTNSVLNLNQWHHVTATFDGTVNIVFLPKVDPNDPNEAPRVDNANSELGIKIYVDGQEVSAANDIPLFANYQVIRNTLAPLTIGALHYDTTAAPDGLDTLYNGDIADTVIFNKALSQEEVTELYNGGLVKDMNQYSAYDNIISWWKMGDDLDTTAAGGIIDYVGGHNGTLQGQASIQPAPDLLTDEVVESGRYGWFTKLVGFEVTGRGKHFIVSNDTQVVNREYIYSAKHRPPEVINSEDLIEIRTQDDLTFTKDAQVVTHFFAAEKSMYQVISDDMINLFATIVEFNNLIGQPVNRYRLQYKALEKFRARYFEKVNNVPSLEKYIELYKWIDSSIGLMLQELIPVSSNFSADLRNMVESHVLERNKYWTKFPTMEMSGEPPLGILKGVGELTYNWKDGHGTDPITEISSGSLDFTGFFGTNSDSLLITITDSTGSEESFEFQALFGSTGDIIFGSIQVNISSASNDDEVAQEFITALGFSTLNVVAEQDGTTVKLQNLSNPAIVATQQGSNIVPDITLNSSELKPLWLDQRVQGTDPLVTTGDADVDENREILRRVSTRKTGANTQVVRRGNDFVEEDKPVLRESPLVPATNGNPAVPGPVYSGQAYVTRALARPYKLNLDIAHTIHGGANYSPTTKDPNSFVRASTKISSASGIEVTFGNNPVIYQGFSYDDQPVKRTVNIVIEDSLLDLGADGSFIYPYYETVADPTPEITNLHNDSYGDDAEIPLQGPFAETWVGGNQHRHVDFVTQTDRPELFIDDAGTLKHPFELGQPAARYTRDEVAKRPVNIRNIKTGESRLLGNYARDYEVVQTSSRTKNNRWFVKNEGVTDTLTTAPIEGAQDFVLPDRTKDINGEVFGKSKHVFVERFSAPGDPLTLSRGYLDRVAEEFSVYNSMNYRNLDERTEYNADLSSHSALYEGSQGYVADTNGLPNIHKINRNTVHIPTGQNYDNAYVCHQIPRSDFQYNVQLLRPTTLVESQSTTINAVNVPDAPQVPAGYTYATLADGFLDGYGFAGVGIDGAIISRATISFDVVKRSTVFDEKLYFQYKLGDSAWTTLEIFNWNQPDISHHVEEIDLGQSVDEPLFVRWISIENDNVGGLTGWWDIKNIQCISTSFENYLTSADITSGSNDYADYQGAGYRFIRNLEKTQVINQRKTNTYSQLDRISRIGLEDRSVSTFVEPAVVWNKPNTHYVLNEEYDEKIRNAEAGSLVNVDINKGSLPITYSYSNNLEMFSNEELTRAVDIDKISGAEFSNTLMNIFRRAELLFSRSIAREIIYPKHKNVGLKKTRFRSEFDNYKFFWKDKMFDRIKCSNTTKLGYEITPEFQQLFNQVMSVDVVDNFHYKDENEQYLTFSGSGSYVYIPDDDTLSFTDGQNNDQPFSFSAWVNTEDYNIQPGFRLLSKYDPADSLSHTQDPKEYDFYIEGGVLYTNFYDFDYFNAIDGPVILKSWTIPTPANKVWDNFTVTYDGSEASAGVKAYMNGVLLTVDTESVGFGVQGMKNTDEALTIGENLLGHMQHVALFNKELTQNEVVEVVSVKSLDNTTVYGDIVSYWKFDTNLLDSVFTNHGFASNVDFMTIKAIGDLTYMGENRMRHMITRRDSEPLHPSAGYHSALDELCPSEDISGDIIPVYSSEEIEQQKRAPIPSPQLYHNPYNEVYVESEGWINRKSIVSGQKPTYNDYDSYSEEIRLAAQKYGLVSEFRISEHMDKYILENGGNFRAKNYKFLTLDGASYDGETQTFTSEEIFEETSSYYSVKKDTKRDPVAYPTDYTYALLSEIKNNADGYFGFNPIYSPSPSTFDISNSVNSELEINETEAGNYLSVVPYQNGINASGKFNLYSADNDFLEVTIDNFRKLVPTLVGKTPVTENALCVTNSAFGSEHVPTPFAVSIWAQPEQLQDDAEADYSNGIWSLSNAADEMICLFSNFNYSDGAVELADYTKLGLTLVVTESATGNPGLPGSVIDDNSTVYTFVNPKQETFIDGNEEISYYKPAFLQEGTMNNIVLQVVPPHPDNYENNNFLIKLWLNGVELYGTHIRELSDPRFFTTDSKNAYSPCPIGKWQGIGSPWSYDYEESGPFTSSFQLREISFLTKAEIGRVTSNHKFRGLLDEFCIFEGILPSFSIEKIYNEGKPNNVNELVANNQIVGSTTYSDIIQVMTTFGSFSYPTTNDNGEFDLIGHDIYTENFNNSALDQLPNSWTSNETNEVELSGPVVQSNGDGTNRALALRGLVDAPNEVDDPPGNTAATDFYRWVQPVQVFNKDIRVTFRVYEGRTNGEYGCTEPPSPTAGEFLWFQYSDDNGITWNTPNSGQFTPGNGEYNLDKNYEFTIDVGSSPTKLRWISLISTNDLPAVAGFDHWAIDNIGIYDKELSENTPADSSGRQRIELREENSPSASHCPFATADFDDNYLPNIQSEFKAKLPIWHRIGVPYYDIVTKSSSWNEEFFNSYVHTDNINFIEKADRRHDELGVSTTEKVKLKVNAIKKLLPYEGFYPQDRTVQLADLFVQKITPDILHNEKVYKEQAIQAALQHFFAPGILYNSIKAGVACDWATYTNESGLEPSYVGDSVTIYGQSGAISQKFIKSPAPYWYMTSVQDAYSEDRTTDNDLLNTFGDVIDDISDHMVGQGSRIIQTVNPLVVFNGFRIRGLVLDKSPNKRLPFESILDPFKYLNDASDGEKHSFSQDPAVTTFPKVEKKSNQHFLTYPSYYTDFANWSSGPPNQWGGVELNNYYNYCYPYFEIKEDSSQKDFRYEMGINNFIAEATKFFIKEERLSSFASGPEKDFQVMKQGVTYYMDIVMEKDSSFKPVNSPGSLGGRYFGPPSSLGDNPTHYELDGVVRDPAYAPYTPPYFYGSSVARVSFTPTQTRKYTLQEIFTLSDTEFINKEAANLFRNTNIELTSKNPGTGVTQDGTDGNFEQSSNAWVSRMPLDASLELFGKTSVSRQEYDSTGNPSSISSSNDTELDTWVIYTKFECPLFDFSSNDNSSDEGTLFSIGMSEDTVETKLTENYEYASSHLGKIKYEDIDFTVYGQLLRPSKVDRKTGSGIWAGFGQQEDGKGVTISIRESFPKGSGTGSLINVCGFTPESKQVGRVADSKEISEAVVMIPFLDKPLLERVIYGVAGTNEVYSTIQVDDRNFIKVDPVEYREQMRKLVRGEPVYTTASGEEIRRTSITNMIEGMDKYNVPPLYDFNQYSEQPFAMYFFEFKHTLDREDLSNIWQGLQPKIAKEATLDSVEISHEINEHELFGNLGEIPKGVRWMVFKVKKKAEKSYYNLTEDSRDDSRFTFDFDVGTKEPEYGYNYPYDYFTMLEMIEVEANSEKEIEPLEQLNRALARDED